MPGAKRPTRARQLSLLAAPAPLPELSPAARDSAIPAALGQWFDAAARDLPWRHDRTPYAVWLSEVMLQQTRVDTVVPYFHRFMSRFPDVGALAAADLDDVLHLWSGLGYYRRARQLHLTAKEVTARYGGVFPEGAPELRSLSGIGAYTAGAISSIAYGRREALVDGNVARVLARLEGIDDDIKSPEVVRRLWATAARLVPDDRPGRFNEGLMELGATVCTPRDPRCDACPLARFCVARAAGREGEIPVSEARRKVPRVDAFAAVMVGREGRVLFARRREGGLFGGLWEPPMVEGVSSLAAAGAAFAAIGVAIGPPLAEAGRVTHVLTHRRMAVTVVTGRAERLEPPDQLGAPYEKSAWLDPVAPGVGVSTLARKILTCAGVDEKG